MYSFWESILFGSGGYKGSPMVKHIDLNKTERLKSKHFERWKLLWGETVESLFNGPKENEAISRASSIAALMEFKVQQS
jgi:hemoglobin